MKQFSDKNDEICGLCRFHPDEENLVTAYHVKKEIKRAFDDKRAFYFFPDTAIISAIGFGTDVSFFREKINETRNRIFDEVSSGDYMLRSRFDNDIRLCERISGAISLLYTVLASPKFSSLRRRRFVLIKELPGKPTIHHLSRETTVLSHIGQGPYWNEIPTVYIGLRVFDAVDTFLKHGDASVYKALESMLSVEERAIETGFAHTEILNDEIRRDLDYLLDCLLDYAFQRAAAGPDAENEKITFTSKMRERYLELLNARDKSDEMNFDYQHNLLAIEELTRHARRFKRGGDKKSLREVVRLLVSASGHDSHEVRNRANIALERVFAPKEYDAPVSEVFYNIHAGESLRLSLLLPDSRTAYFLRIYENASTSEFPVESELRFSDIELSYDEGLKLHICDVSFDAYGHRDFCVVCRSGERFEWVEGDNLSGRINVLPEMRGEVFLEIFTDIYGSGGFFWSDESGHPGLVYNENGEVIRLGRFSDVEHHLEFLKKSYGLTGIYLLGIQKRGTNAADWRIGASSPSPFSPASMIEIENKIGGADELKSLVKKAHRLGIKIIVDCIPHLARESEELCAENTVYCYDSGGKLVERAATDGRFAEWDDCKLPNFRKLEVWEWMISSVERLIEEFDIDGIRFDAAHAVPVMMMRNNYPLIFGERRSCEDMVEGRIIVNERSDGHFVTTGYYDSRCRDVIAVPFHQYMMFRIEKAVRRKRKDYFINIAECNWGHERFLSRSGIIPDNTALFKVCENIIAGKSDVREIYSTYDSYYPSSLCHGTELVGMLSSHEDRRFLKSFEKNGMMAAIGLTSFLSTLIMDCEGMAEGDGWKVLLDNVYVNWNDFGSNPGSSGNSFRSEIYSFHRRIRGKGHLVWANNNMVAAAVKGSADGREIWVGVFSFAETNQAASIEFSNPSLPLDDEAFYRVVDPIYSGITGHYNYYSGRELRVSRINTVVSSSRRSKLLRIEKIDDITPFYREFFRDSFFRLCSISRKEVFGSFFAFNEISKRLSDFAGFASFVDDVLVPLFFQSSKQYLELGLKRSLFHAVSRGKASAGDVLALFDSMSASDNRRIAEIGRALKNHNSPGAWVFMSAEADPFTKSGGLANVVFELPRELAREGEQVYVITPYYRSGDSKSVSKMKFASEKYGIKYTGVNVRFQILDAQYEVGIHESLVDGVKYYLLDHHELFDGLYWGLTAEEKLVRRVGFARAAAELICTFNISPYFTFTNDAYCGPFNGIVRCDQTYYSNPNFQRTSFFHIIHNGGWQYFDAYNRYENALDLFRLFNLPDWHYGEFSDPANEGKINCMAAGIRFADRVFTVSPSYARQIEYQCDGLERILKNVKGISNAVGRDLLARIQAKFDAVNFVGRNHPRLMDLLSKDDSLRAKIELKYPELLGGLDCVKNIKEEKRRYIVNRVMNKLMLQVERGLDVDPDKVMFVMIHRMTEQKGFGLLMKASEGVFRNLGLQGIVGGAVSSGDEKGEEIAHGLWLMGQYYPKNACVAIGFQELSVPLMSADFFLMPSMHEPGGISQIEAFICGSLVLARATGGLRDTVFPIRKNGRTIDGNGFLFTDYMPEAFLDAMTRAHKFFSQSSDDEIYQARCNSRNSAYFWDKPAGEYLDAAYAAKEIIRREK